MRDIVLTLILIEPYHSAFPFTRLGTYSKAQ
jgi:hypothetical protein